MGFREKKRACEEKDNVIIIACCQKLRSLRARKGSLNLATMELLLWNSDFEKCNLSKTQEILVEG